MAGVSCSRNYPPSGASLGFDMQEVYYPETKYIIFGLQSLVPFLNQINVPTEISPDKKKGASRCFWESFPDTERGDVGG